MNTHKLSKANKVIDRFARNSTYGFSKNPKVKSKDLAKGLRASNVQKVSFNIIKSVTIRPVEGNVFFANGDSYPMYEMAFVSEKDGKPYYVNVFDNTSNRILNCLMLGVNGTQKCIDKARPVGIFQVSTVNAVINLTYDSGFPHLVVNSISADFQPRFQKGVWTGKWKSGSGAVVLIKDMNEYHLKNALRKCVRDEENRSKFFELKNEIHRRGISL